MGKFDVVVADDRLHLFALTLPNHDVVLHSVSDDGLAWQAMPNALYCGEPGSCDDDQIWSVAVVADNDGYTMLYTALAQADDGLVQRIACAASSDLVHWTKTASGPVAEPDARWYATAPSADGRVSWRDAKPIWIDGVSYAPLCAHERSGALLRRGCVGLLRSEDLVNWSVEPPLLAPRNAWDLECPQLIRLGPAWYLLASVSEDRTQRCWIAPAMHGPFRMLDGGGRVGPDGYYAGRVVHWRGQDLLFSQATGDAPRAGFARRSGKYLSPPLALVRDPTGRLRCESFGGWSAYLTEALQPLAPREHSELAAQASAGAWCVQSNDALDVLLASRELIDCWLEAELVLDAARGGLVFGFDSDGAGLFVELQPSTAEISLQRWRVGARLASERPFNYTELQHGRWSAPVQRGASVRVSVRRVGPYFECSINGAAILAAFIDYALRGGLGLWSEGGSSRAESMVAAPMRAPVHA